MPRSSSSKGPVRKPRADIFTVLLALALVAMIAACAFLYIDVSRYEARISPRQPAASAVETVVAAATPINPSETGFQTPVTCLS